MSRVGKMPVTIPAGVKVTIANGSFTVEGPKGKLSQNYHSDAVDIKIEGSEAIVTRKNDELQTRAYHGLYRSLLNNMIRGVSTGFSKTLVINGVGYKAELQDKLLVMSLGYSNDFAVLIPEGLEVKVDQLKITISGASKEAVGEFASQVRKLRCPEPYKGKGIRYEDEVIIRKVGKSGVK